MINTSKISKDIHLPVIPKRWIEKNLIELLLSLESGSRPKGGVKRITEGIPSIGAEHLNDSGGFNFSNLKYVPLSFAERMTRGKLEKDDILIVKDGATSGKTSFIDSKFPFENAYVNEHVFICRPSKQINPKYLFWFLWSIEGNKRILKNFKGTAQGGINHSFASNCLIPIAPIEEQNLIVAKLDELIEKISYAEIIINKIPDLISASKEKKLSSFFDIREKYNKKTISLIESKLEDVCFSIVDGDHQSPSRSPDGIPFITISDISKKGLNIPEVSKYVSLDYYLKLPDKKKPKKGDVLFTVTGSIGIPIIVDTELPFSFQRHIAILKVDKTKILSKYLFYLLLSENIKERMISVATGTAQLTIPLKELRSFKITLPPLDIQRAIIRKIELHYKKLDLIEIQAQILREKLQYLPQQLLQEAFSGKLVKYSGKEVDENLMQTIEEEKKDYLLLANKIKKDHIKKNAMKKEPSQSLLKLLERKFSKQSFTYEEIKDEFQQFSNYLKNRDELFSLLRNKTVSMKFQRSDGGLNFTMKKLKS